jgi:hypothetical protein
LPKPRIMSALLVPVKVSGSGVPFLVAIIFS